MVDAVARHDSVCNSFHIPFQSGNDKVLREMGRGHTRKTYMKVRAHCVTVAASYALEGSERRSYLQRSLILTSLCNPSREHTVLKIISRIRTAIPDASITADVIVGFPGETEEEFLDTLSLMEEVRFDSCNTAAYSPRPNTPAATWDNQVTEEIKSDRLQRINRLNLKHAEERRARMVGRTVEVLVEGRNVKRPSQVFGRTEHG